MVPRRKLTYAALLSLFAFVLLALAVAYSQGPYGFEEPVFEWLGTPASTHAWINVTTLLAAPLIITVLIVCVAVGIVSRTLFRVTVYVTFGAVALFANEYVAKPLVQRSYVGEFSFPSGNVTAVAATALAVWLGLFPILGTRTRCVVLVIGAAWTLVMALAVVGAQWHTPLDDLGSILLSVGVVTGGAAVFEHAAARRRQRAS